jgi:hypothetical protein
MGIAVESRALYFSIAVTRSNSSSRIPKNMLVSKHILLEALRAAKHRKIPVKVTALEGIVPDEWCLISDLNIFKNAYGENTLALILLPLPETYAVVIEFQYITGIKFAKSIIINGSGVDELSVLLKEMSVHAY